MKLKNETYRIFMSSKTPAGLYARKKWLGEAGSQPWKVDFKETVNRLYAGQDSDGSWHQSSIETIQRLFGLHLTVREPDERTDTAMEWLLSKKHSEDLSSPALDKGGIAGDQLNGLPFIPSRMVMFEIGASLFLATILGYADDPRVISLYRNTIREERTVFWNDPGTASNLFRAFVVHPIFQKDSIVREAVKSLRFFQDGSGAWGERLPFYQLVNALAHLDSHDVDEQLENAFRKLITIQNEDGSWSDDQPEWNTFLVVHAFKNKGLL
jgi:hypothetical protein